MRASPAPVVRAFPSRARRCHAALLAALITSAASASAWADVQASGVYDTYLLLHRVGSERFSLAGDAARGGRLSIASRVSDRGTVRATTTELEFGPGLAPLRLETRREGVAAPSTLTVVRGGVVEAQEIGTRRSFPAPAVAFPGQTSMPAALQAAMFDDWRRHGRPARLALLRAQADAPPVRIVPVGHDTVVVGGRRVRLTRHTVADLVFGREVAWTDPEGRLVAVMTFAAGLPQEQVLEAYAPAFSQLVASGVRQEMADLAQLTREVRPEATGAYAIVGARLIDGRGGPPVEDAVVVVRDGRIAAVGGRGALRPPAGMRVIDARGLSLLPGLWEMHVHYSGVEFGPALLAAGITTARDCGGEFGFLTALRARIAAGDLGPRLLLAGLVDSGGPLAFGAVDVETPAEAVAAVDRYADAWFDQIKVYTQLKPEVLRAVAAEAHRRGLTVTGHVPAAVDAFEGVADGMDQINHLQFVTAAMREPGATGPIDLTSERARRLMALLADRRIVVDPTDGWGEMASHPRSVLPDTFEPGLDEAPFTLRTKYEALGGDGEPGRWRARLEENGRVIAALHAAGVPLVAGTDTGLLGYGLDRELELYVQAGLTPADALYTATLGAARAMGRDGDSGSVEVGKRADLVLVRGDPLTRISDLRRVEKVVSAGRLYDSRALARSVGFKRETAEASDPSQLAGRGGERANGMGSGADFGLDRGEADVRPSKPRGV